MKYLILASAVLLSASLEAARPVARWDVIPYQRVSKNFKAGVVAFHEKGVKVEFTVNGKVVATAEKPEFNGRTKVCEHFFVFEAAKYSDGPVTLGATAITEGEQPYKLQDIVIYANSKKTLGSRKASWVDPVNGNDFAEGTKDAPVKTMKQAVNRAGDGGTVNLMAGDYQAKLIGGGKDRKYWTLIQPAPGVDRAQVRFLGGRTGTDKLHFKNVEFYCNVSDGYGTVIMGESGETSAWFDNCKIYNKPGRLAGSTIPFGNKLKAYVTGGVTTSISSGPHAELVRGHEITSIAGDAFYGSDMLVVNTTVSDIDADGTSTEPDLHRAFAAGQDWVHDVILYNIEATGIKGRAFSGTRFRDSAIVSPCEPSVTSYPVKPAQRTPRRRTSVGAKLARPLFLFIHCQVCSLTSTFT